MDWGGVSVVQRSEKTKKRRLFTLNKKNIMVRSVPSKKVRFHLAETVWQTAERIRILFHHTPFSPTERKPNSEED